jgi:hypothetical protein
VSSDVLVHIDRLDEPYAVADDNRVPQRHTLVHVLCVTECIAFDHLDGVCERHALVDVDRFHQRRAFVDVDCID